MSQSDMEAQSLPPEDSQSPQAEGALVFLDTETTGLDHKNEKLLEIAAVKVVDGEIIETFSSLINPQAPIRYSSFLIHGISEEMVENAPTIEEVLPSFLEFMGTLPYVAHNAIFDYSFINEAMKAIYNKRFKNHRIDTFEMYRSVFPDEPSHGLSALLARFDFDPEVKHRALDDAMCLAKVYPRLRDLYEQKHRWQLSQLENVPYLVERYIRIQRTTQVLQAEMSDLKDIFKLYFAEGGKPVEASSGELMVSSYKRSYNYDDEQIWPILLEAGVAERAYKLNPRVLDKLLDTSGGLAEEHRIKILESRQAMNESRMINFIKPQPPSVGTGEAETTAPAVEDSAVSST